MASSPTTPPSWSPPSMRWDQFKFFGGYEHIRYTNPAYPLGVGAIGSGRLSLERRRRRQSRFAQDCAGLAGLARNTLYDSKTDITLSYYHRAAERLPHSVDLLARPPVSAAPARVLSTKCRSMWIITSPSASTSTQGLRTPTSAAGSPSPFLTAPASPITTTAILLPRSVDVSASDRDARAVARLFLHDLVIQRLAAPLCGPQL